MSFYNVFYIEMCIHYLFHIGIKSVRPSKPIPPLNIIDPPKNGNLGEILQATNLPSGLRQILSICLHSFDVLRFLLFTCSLVKRSLVTLCFLVNSGAIAGLLLSSPLLKPSPEHSSRNVYISSCSTSSISVS